MNTLIETSKMVTGKQEFVRFLAELRHDLEARPEDWANGNLSSFLEAMADWIEDMEGYYHNTCQPVPTQVNWRFMADALLAARIYE